MREVTLCVCVRVWCECVCDRHYLHFLGWSTRGNGGEEIRIMIVSGLGERHSGCCAHPSLKKRQQKTQSQERYIRRAMVSSYPCKSAGKLSGPPRN